MFWSSGWQSTTGAFGLVRAVILELHGSLSRIPLTVRSVISYSTPASKSKKSTVVLFFEKYFSLLFPNWSSRKNLYRSKEFLVSDKFKVIELFVKDTLFRVVIQVGKVFMLLIFFGTVFASSKTPNCNIVISS